MSREDHSRVRVLQEVIAKQTLGAIRKTAYLERWGYSRVRVVALLQPRLQSRR